MAYVHHIRETNLAATMRVCRENNLPIPERTADELLAVLKDDQMNQGSSEPIASAIEMLESNVDSFLETYFTVVPDQRSKGPFSVTSR